MTTSPTGRVIRTSLGRALVLERTFSAPIEDVWASITESARLERWIGRCRRPRRDAAAGVGRLLPRAA